MQSCIFPVGVPVILKEPDPIQSVHIGQDLILSVYADCHPLCLSSLGRMNDEMFTAQSACTTRPHRDHTPCVWRLCRPSYILLLLCLYPYMDGLSANSLRIIMAAGRLVWLARPSRKRPEAWKGRDHPQNNR